VFAVNEAGIVLRIHAVAGVVLGGEEVELIADAQGRTGGDGGLEPPSVIVIAGGEEKDGR
jgi:hypothetical protein